MEQPILKLLLEDVEFRAAIHSLLSPKRVKRVEKRTPRRTTSSRMQSSTRTSVVTPPTMSESQLTQSVLKMIPLILDAIRRNDATNMIRKGDCETIITQIVLSLLREFNLINDNNEELIITLVVLSVEMLCDSTVKDRILIGRESPIYCIKSSFRSLCRSIRSKYDGVCVKT